MQAYDTPKLDEILVGVQFCAILNEVGRGIVPILIRDVIGYNRL